MSRPHKEVGDGGDSVGGDEVSVAVEVLPTDRVVTVMAA